MHQDFSEESSEVGNQLVVARRYGLDPRLVSVWVCKSRNGSGRKTKLSDKVKQLEEENQQLKKLVADLALKTSILEDLQKKRTNDPRAVRGGNRVDFTWHTSKESAENCWYSAIHSLLSKKAPFVTQNWFGRQAS